MHVSETCGCITYIEGADKLNIIADHLHPYMVFVFPTGNGVFEQGNAPCHSARIVLEWLKEHNTDFQLGLWQLNSTYLNPIKQIWGAM